MRDKRTHFGEETLREWYKEYDPIQGLYEIILNERATLDQASEQILGVIEGKMKMPEKIYSTLTVLCGPVVWISLAIYLIADITIRPSHYGLAALAAIPTAMVYLVVGALSGYTAVMVWQRYRWAIILSLIGLFFMELLAMFYVIGLVAAEGATAVAIITGGLLICAGTLLLGMHVFKAAPSMKVEKRARLTPFFIVLVITVALLLVLLVPLLILMPVLGSGGLWVPGALSAALVIITALFWMVAGVYKKKRGALLCSLVAVPLLSLYVVLSYSIAAPAIGIGVWALGMAAFLTAGDNELRQKNKVM